MKLRYYLIFQCPILHKAPITGGVWVVSGGVCLVSGMCLRTEQVSGCSNTKSIGKIWIRPYSDFALSSSTLYCIKTSISGGVWMMSEGVWMMSRWCLRVSGEASIPNLLANKYNRPWYSDIAFSSSALYCIKMPMSWGVWIVSGSVWMGSEGVWRCINTKYFGKNLYRSC